MLNYTVWGRSAIFTSVGETRTPSPVTSEVADGKAIGGNPSLHFWGILRGVSLDVVC